MIVYAHFGSHAFNVKVVGTYKGKGPALLLKLVYKILYHLEIILLAAVLLAIRNNGHQHRILVGCLRVYLCYAHSNSVVQRCCTARIIFVASKFVGHIGCNVVVYQALVRTVKRYQRNVLLKFLVCHLHLADCLKCLVDAHQSLLLDYCHAATLVYYQ